jgi:predicted DNA-binding transcriptional regulator AlpA
MDDNIRLIDLTVKDLKEVIKEIFEEHYSKIENDKPLKVIEPDIIYIEEVCELTNLKRGSVYNKVSRREIPTLSRRQPLSFSRKEINDWMETGRPSYIERKVKAELYRLNNDKG